MEDFNLEINLVRREKQIILLGHQKGLVTLHDIYRFYKDRKRAAETMERLVDMGFFSLGALPLTFNYIDNEKNQEAIGILKRSVDPEYRKRYLKAVNKKLKEVV